MVFLSALREMQFLIEDDLSNIAKKPVSVMLHAVNSSVLRRTDLSGTNIDELNVQIQDFEYNPMLLENSTDLVKVGAETLNTHLFRSKCPVTGQPDWASIEIDYFGPLIKKENLLQYLVSFRNHQSFHESVIETIFVDILKYCQPNKLTVAGHFLRRGGLDINPIRTNDVIQDKKHLLFRQ